MIDLIFALKTSLVITAIHASFWDDMVLGNFRANVLDNIFNDFWKKPIYSCVICMASLWGTLSYLKHFWLCYNPLHYIIFILTVAGINTLISGIIYLAYERNLGQ